MSIDYDYKRNPHSLGSPRAALPIILAERKPESLLDVGCGNGTWLKAALELGVTSILGVDGVAIASDEFLVPQDFFRKQDLSAPLDFGRKFDLVLCLEVAEHLEAENSETLIQSLVRHSDFIVFSAACPGQPGQHHVNCRWPDYWQRLFNKVGFACEDSLRWRLWNQREVEPWYRQNVFSAYRDPAGAGMEKRIEAVIHPDLLPLLNEEACVAYTRKIEAGCLPAKWYAGTCFSAFRAKTRKRLTRG